jgi:hypothetical protein
MMAAEGLYLFTCQLTLSEIIAARSKAVLGQAIV